MIFIHRPCDSSKVVPNELSAAYIPSLVVEYELENGNSSPTNKVFDERFQRIDSKPPWVGIVTVEKCATGPSAGHTIICLTNAEGNYGAGNLDMTLTREKICLLYCHGVLTLLQLP
ncbi:hypothetical protein FXO38_19447 [Capsicum annuum]|nr:hypothetical protein FXO38_19447 [Capsicum annuum]